jgi:hypothetical protein
MYRIILYILAFEFFICSLLGDLDTLLYEIINWILYEAGSSWIISKDT